MVLNKSTNIRICSFGSVGIEHEVETEDDMGAADQVDMANAIMADGGQIEVDGQTYNVSSPPQLVTQDANGNTITGV